MVPKMPKNKIGLYVIIDHKLYEELKRLAFSKHGTLKGALSREVEEALRYWLALERKKEKIFSDVGSDGNPKVYKVFSKVKEYLNKKYGLFLTSGSKISGKYLIEAISFIRGSTERTINRWIKDFIKFNLIKHIDENIYEVV